MKGKMIKVLMGLLAFVPMFSSAEVKGSLAYVDLEKVFSSKVISTKFEDIKAEFDKRHDEFQAAQDRLERLVSEHEKEATMMTKIVRDNREQELKEMAQKLSKQGSEMTQEYYARQQEIKSNYLMQASDISSKIAKKYKLDFVMAKHNLLYADESLDVTDELIAALK